MKINKNLQKSMKINQNQQKSTQNLLKLININ